MAAKPKFCPEHCEIKGMLGEKRFWHKIWDSKWTFWVVTGIVAAFIMFNGWIVSELSAQKTDTAITKQTNEQTSKDIKEIKDQNAQVEKQRQKDVEELKKQNAQTEQRRQDDKMDMMKMLMEIQKELAKKK